MHIVSKMFVFVAVFLSVEPISAQISAPQSPLPDIQARDFSSYNIKRLETLFGSSNQYYQNDSSIYLSLEAQKDGSWPKKRPIQEPDRCKAAICINHSPFVEMKKTDVNALDKDQEHADEVKESFRRLQEFYKRQQEASFITKNIATKAYLEDLERHKACVNSKDAC